MKQTKYTKILKCIDVDSQNIGYNGFNTMEDILNFYYDKTEAEIDAIYADYYGEDEHPKMKFLIVGEFEFPRDDVKELQGRTLIHRIDHFQFVPACKAVEIGEEYITNGYDSYIVMDDYDISTIVSPYKDGTHWWWAKASDGGVVVFNSHMELVVGFFTEEEMLKHFSDKILFKIENQYRDEEHQPVFDWNHHDQENPYYDIFDRKKDAAKRKAEADKKAYDDKVYMKACAIWDRCQVYQNLYRCTEADKELLEDDQLWADVMRKIQTFMATAIEDTDLDSSRKVEKADMMAENAIEEGYTYAIAHRTSDCPVELLYDNVLWEMVMEKMISTIEENLIVTTQKVA